MPTAEQSNVENITEPKMAERQIRVSRSAFGRILVRRLVGAFVLLIAAMAVLYLCSAATVLRFIPVASGVGPVLVKNITYPGGILPPGATVLVNRGSEVKTDWMSKLAQSFTPANDGAVVKVLAGPYGKMTWAQPGIIAVNGKPMKAFFPPAKNGDSPIGADNQFLKDQYLVKCVSGACLSNEAFVVNSNQVYGSPLKQNLTEGR